MRFFNKTTVGLSASLLVLALAAPMIDAKDSSMALVLSIDNSLLVPPKRFRSLQDGNVTDVTVEADVVKEEDDHDHKEEEIAAMEAMCQCTGGNITCSGNDALNHCHCHDGDVHCEADEDHEDGHEDHEEEEIAAMEAMCQCTGGNITCSDNDALNHCHCHDGDVHCEADEDHEDGHEDHEDHDHDHDHSDHSDEEKPWGTVIGASFIINITTLSGIFLVGGHWFRNLLCPTLNPNKAVGHLWANVIIPMFACGTLLATTFFLLLPEALYMISSEFAGGHDDHGHRMLEDHDDHGDEAAATWRWGASIMGGFLFPVALHAFCPTNHPVGHSHIHEAKESAVQSPAAVEESADPETGADDTAAMEKPSSDKTEEASNADKTDEDGYVTLCGCLRLKNLSLFVSMNLGEMLHNFTDGIFVGAAYIGCGPALGNSVVLATVLHEIPNQLAGYLVMVNQNGIDPIVALGLNFVFGLSVLVGALVVLTLDVGNNAIGCIFAIGGGVFLHVASAEMLGTAERNVIRKQHWLWVLLSFVVGAILIGLVLINHEHCGGH